jgi:membrane protein
VDALTLDDARRIISGMRPAVAWRRLVRLVERDIWERDVEDANVVERALVTLRLATVVRRGWARHQLAMRSGSLTYITVFSLVPTLAVGFAMFKAFGGLENAQNVLLPKITGYLAVGVRDEVQAKIREFLGNIRTGAIGATGLVFLIVAAVMLLSSIEDALDDIWGVRPKRTYFQRLTIYWTVVTITPTLLLIGVSLPAILHRVTPLEWVLRWTGTGNVFFSVVVPVVFVSAGFTLLYRFMTEAPVTLAAAAAGGVAGGVLWSAAAWVYSWYARTTVSVYVSWFIVLVGALVAFAWQNVSTYRQEVLAADTSPAARELLALRVMVEAAEALLGPGAPARLDDLSTRLKISRRLVNGVADLLVDAGWLVYVEDRGAVLPARDPARFSPAALLQDLRQRGVPAVWRGHDAMTRALESLQEREAEARARVWEPVTFARIVEAPEELRGTERRDDAPPKRATR